MKAKEERLSADRPKPSPRAANGACRAIICDSIASPMAVDNSPSSKTAPKTCGVSTPRLGCSQRASASKPMIRPVAQVDLRLVEGHELAGGERLSHLADEGDALLHDLAHAPA